MDGERILIVEDEAPVLAFYTAALEGAGYHTRGARSGRAALEAFAGFDPALVVLDIALLGELDGFDVLAGLRRHSAVRVLMLTGQTGDTRLVRGLNLGADQYVLKPVSQVALVARVQALLRRAPTEGLLGQASGVYGYADLEIDLERDLIVHGDGRRFTVQGQERLVLARLLHTPGQVVAQQELWERAWRSTERLVRWDDARALLSCIYRLRSKLDRGAGRPPVLETVRGRGFRMARPERVGAGRGAGGDDVDR